jgi:hypothetical protein
MSILIYSLYIIGSLCFVAGSTLALLGAIGWV